jgi:hypothetical protein
MWVRIDQHAILEDQRFRFIRVADDILRRSIRLRDEAPLASGRKARPTPTGESRRFDFVDDRGGRAAQGDFQSEISAALDGGFDRIRIDLAGVRQHHAHLAGTRLRIIGRLAAPTRSDRADSIGCERAGLIVIHQSRRGAIA